MAEEKGVQFYMPGKPITIVDAINRRAAATGSVRYAQMTGDADYNGHPLNLYWNDYRGYYVCDYHWGERVVIARGENFADILAASKRELARQGRGGSLSINVRACDAHIARSDAGVIEGRCNDRVYWTPEQDGWKFKLISEAALWQLDHILIKATSEQEWKDAVAAEHAARCKPVGMASKKRPFEDDFIAARKKPAAKITLKEVKELRKVDAAPKPAKKSKAKKPTPGTLPAIQAAITKKLRAKQAPSKTPFKPFEEGFQVAPIPAVLPAVQKFIDDAKASAFSPSILRQQWIDAAEKALRLKFKDCGHVVPAELRISIGFPKGTGGKGSVYLGQCWGLDASKDKHTEIFINPVLDDGARIMDVMAHEFVHAVVGNKAGHKAPFKRVALSIGLAGKMTATVASDEFAQWAQDQIALIGKYPGAALNPSSRKKQGTRLLKCECSICGYLARVTAKWVNESGAPICPTDSKVMSCDAGDDGGDDDE